MTKTKTKTITYRELARRVGDMVLFNNITNVDTELYEKIKNGSFYYDNDGDTEMEYSENIKEVYQFYAVNDGGAEYMIRNTEEIIFYSDICDMYIWGVTHYGNSWDRVTLEIKE